MAPTASTHARCRRRRRGMSYNCHTSPPCHESARTALRCTHAFVTNTRTRRTHAHEDAIRWKYTKTRTCALTKARLHRHAHTHTHAGVCKHVRERTHTHSLRTEMHTHTHAHTHTHTKPCTHTRSLHAHAHACARTQTRRPTCRETFMRYASLQQHRTFVYIPRMQRDHPRPSPAAHLRRCSSTRRGSRCCWRRRR
jgi:hypothetical protein